MRTAIQCVSIGRARVTRAATGMREVFYSYQRPRWWQVRRWWRIMSHLRLMRAEDQKEGW